MQGERRGSQAMLTGNNNVLGDTILDMLTMMDALTEQVTLEGVGVQQNVRISELKGRQQC